MGNFFYQCCYCFEDDSGGESVYNNNYHRRSSTSNNAPWRRLHVDGNSNINASSNGGVPLLQEDQRNNSPENSNSVHFIPEMGRKGMEDLLISSLQASLVPRSLEEERSFMVRSMSSSLMDLEKEPECLFCLEGFTEENPCIKSLCGCGVNKSPLHLQCLEQWRKKSTECPSCGQPLFYEMNDQQLTTHSSTVTTSSVVVVVNNNTGS
jgi:hypothetical protein